MLRESLRINGSQDVTLRSTDGWVWLGDAALMQVSRYEVEDSEAHSRGRNVYESGRWRTGEVLYVCECALDTAHCTQGARNQGELMNVGNDGSF